MGWRRAATCQVRRGSRKHPPAGGSARREHVFLVVDPLNNHSKGGFYEVFEPARERDGVQRIRSRYTLKHGGWLRITEYELIALTRQ